LASQSVRMLSVRTGLMRIDQYLGWRTCTLFVGEACHIGGVKCTAQPLLLLKLELEFELELELENTARAFQQYGTRTVQGR
jgi:hypothetical protein